MSKEIKDILIKERINGVTINCEDLFAVIGRSICAIDTGDQALDNTAKEYGLDPSAFDHCIRTKGKHKCVIYDLGTRDAHGRCQAVIEIKAP